MTIFKVPKPIGDRILIEVDRDDNRKQVKSQVIQIVQTEDTKFAKTLDTNVGTIVTFGQAAKEHGLLVGDEDELKVGQKIMFLKHAGLVADCHENPDLIYRLIRRGDIMAVIGE